MTLPPFADEVMKFDLAGRTKALACCQVSSSPPAPIPDNMSSTTFDMIVRAFGENCELSSALATNNGIRSLPRSLSAHPACSAIASSLTAAINTELARSSNELMISKHAVRVLGTCDTSFIFSVTCDSDDSPMSISASIDRWRYSSLSNHCTSFAMP